MMWLRQMWAKLIWLPMDFLRGDQSEVTHRFILALTKVWQKLWIDGPWGVIITLLILKAIDTDTEGEK